MDKLSKEQIISMYNDLIISGEISAQEFHKNEKLFKEQYIQQYMAKDDYIPKDRITTEMGYFAYIYILETGASAQEAFVHMAEHFGKTEEFIQTSKNLPHYPAREVYNRAEDHSQQKLMKSNNTLRTKTLTSAQTANRQLKELEVNKRVSDQLEELKETDKRQQQEIDRLNMSLNTTDADVHRLQVELNIEGLSNKEKALILKSKGYKQKAIAEHLGVSLRTIKNWWNTDVNN